MKNLASKLLISAMCLFTSCATPKYSISCANANSMLVSLHSSVKLDKHRLICDILAYNTFTKNGIEYPNDMHFIPSVFPCDIHENVADNSSFNYTFAISPETISTNTTNLRVQWNSFRYPRKLEFVAYNFLGELSRNLAGYDFNLRGELIKRPIKSKTLKIQRIELIK